MVSGFVFVVFMVWFRYIIMIWFEICLIMFRL